jgi:hypothetical protein
LAFVIPRQCHLRPALAGSGAPRRNHFRPSIVFIASYKGKKSGAFQEKWLAAYMKEKKRRQWDQRLRGFATLNR